jgi:lipopolysaccharide biosynthesis protein
MLPKLIAFYLPQFHPIPENDEWWGKGFTEWHNVVTARSYFSRHDHPRIPTDLGFYDLRLPETRAAQASLARQYGIYGFCYWHYWFHGRRLLERPVNEILCSGEPNFPFCLAWANESWSRSWLGDDKKILIKQTYSDSDDIKHAQWLAEAFSDKRYIRVRNRPLLLIYRPTSLPNPQKTTDTIRNEVVRLGIPEPYIVGINAHAVNQDMRSLGFDITEHHEPQLGVLPGVFSKAGMKRRLRNKIQRAMGRPEHVFNYAEARHLMDKIKPQHPHLPCYFIGWDNTARRGNKAIVITKAEPEEIGIGLKNLIKQTMSDTSNEQIIFINAWNEWAEGMYLEPDRTYGRRRLKMIIDSLTEAQAESS